MQAKLVGTFFDKEQQDLIFWEKKKRREIGESRLLKISARKMKIESYIDKLEPDERTKILTPCPYDKLFLMAWKWRWLRKNYSKIILGCKYIFSFFIFICSSMETGY